MVLKCLLSIDRTFWFFFVKMIAIKWGGSPQMFCQLSLVYTFLMSKPQLSRKLCRNEKKVGTPSFKLCYLLQQNWFESNLRFLWEETCSQVEEKWFFKGLNSYNAEIIQANKNHLMSKFETSSSLNFTNITFFHTSGDLTPSQFPVFTIYVQKNCLKSAAKCASAWSFERVSDFGLTATEISKSQQDSRATCMDTCLNDDACRYGIDYLI